MSWYPRSKMQTTRQAKESQRGKKHKEKQAVKLKTNQKSWRTKQEGKTQAQMMMVHWCTQKKGGEKEKDRKWKVKHD